MRRASLARAITALMLAGTLSAAGGAAVAADSGWGRSAPAAPEPANTTGDSGWGVAPAESNPPAPRDPAAADSGWG